MEELTKERVTDLIVHLEKEALVRWEKGDPDGYLALYAEDITYFDPVVRLVGHEAMSNYYDKVRGKILADYHEILDPVVQVSGNIAVMSFNFRSVTGEETFRWNCTEVYRQEVSGEWKIIHNHWSPVKTEEK